MYWQWVLQVNSEAAPLHTPGDPEGRKIPSCVLLFLQAWKGKKQLFRNHAENQPTLPPALVLVVFLLLLNFFLFLSSVVGICLLFLKVTLSLASFLVAPPKEGSDCDFPWECVFLGALGSSEFLETVGSARTSSWVLIREDKQKSLWLCELQRQTRGRPWQPFHGV